MDAVSTPARPVHAADRILQAIERNPVAAFAVFVLVHVLLWTVVPALLQRDLQLDAIEGVAYGRDWQLGYWKHPPLPWLLMDITHRIFGARLWPFFLLGQLAAAVAFWATWRFGRELFTPLEAFVAVVILDGSIEYGFNTTAFNHNILELPFFALAGWSLYRAFVGNALRDWLLVGLWFALAFYTKYQAFVLLLPVLAFAVVDPHARQCWRKPGPYVAAAVSGVLCAPQFLWMALVDHFGPIKFAEGKAESALSLFDLLWSTLKFIVNGLFYIIPVAVLFLLLIGPVDRNRPPPSARSDPFARRYLAFLAFGPLVTCVLVGLLSGRRLQSGWAELSWCFISLYLIAQWRPPVDQPALRRLLVGWCGLTGDIYRGEDRHRNLRGRAGISDAVAVPRAAVHRDGDARLARGGRTSAAFLCRRRVLVGRQCDLLLFRAPAAVRKRRSDPQPAGRSGRHPAARRGDPLRPAGPAQQAADAGDQRTVARRIPGRASAPALRHPAANAARRDHLGDRLGLAETAGRGWKRGALS